MTSTSINIGFADKTRLSSRVLRPPGGGHSDIFGSEPEPAQQGRRRHLEPLNNGQIGEAMPNGDGARQEKPVEQATEPASAVAVAPEQAAAGEPAAPAAAAPAAAAPAAAAPAPAPASPPPRRQRVPPGGYSSGLW